MSLAGRAYVVTGAASGIGKATVQALLARSATVHALDLSDNIPVHDGMPGQQFNYPKIDISSRVAVKSTMDSIAKHHHPLAGLANCAGILRASGADEQSDKDFDLMWKVNVLGTWNTNTEFYQCVKNSTPPTNVNPSIVNIGSMASVRGLPHMAGYCASKHAVLGLTRSLAQDWGSDGFRVNCIAPGAVRTPMIAGDWSAGDVSAAYNGAFAKYCEPEDISATILFLIHDSSSPITGQLIEVNGGWP
ncbi:hypothetical protein G7054_g1356 [Neopestalotiopsis clavispora]|nr:hypothetical protein G7054_g1356 [Neopestalotiopsis clavispora]